MSRRLVLNISPIEFNGAELLVGILEYQGRDQLQALRDAHYATHVFRRDGGTRLLCVPVVPEAPNITDTTETIRLLDNLYLCAALIRNALLNYLHQLGRTILGYDPVKFIANGSGEDLLAASVPSGIPCPPWLAVRPLYEVSVRVINLDRQQPFIGCALNVRTTRLITLNCNVLAAEGFPLDDLYVGRLIPRKDVRIAPRLELLGRVREVKEGHLMLDDARPGIESVDASEVMLEPRSAAFERCLSHAFKTHTPRVEQALMERLEWQRSGPGRLEKLRRVITHLSGLRLQMVPGVAFTFQPFLAEGGTEIFPTVHEAPKTVYVFDPTGARTDTWHDGGLDKHGPYTSQSFTPSHPRICVICQATRKGEIEQFLHKFFNGVTAQTGGRMPFTKGFIRKYALEDFSLEFFLTDDDTPEAYRRAVRQALAEQGQRNIKWDLALVQIEERFHDLHGEANPYLITKAAFLSQQIPVQEFEIETVALPDRQLGFVLNNMALATYAKLGGVPWLIKANPTIAHELVIGLGSAQVGEGRLGDRERVVGITTVFTGDGNYWLSNVSQIVPIAEYQGTILTSLKTTFKRIQGDMNWQPREHVRLVFHAFKPMKDAETEAVKELMANLGDYDVEFAFLHVIEDHPYVLFDESQRGVRDFETRRVKGILAPKRSYFFRLSSQEVLISLTGAREVKRPQDGMPRPVLLRLHRASSFHDTTYLARQVFAFSCHSWRSFFPAPMPVTILYSKLIARMLGQLATITHWNPDAMLGRIGRTRWFL